MTTHSSSHPLTGILPVDKPSGPTTYDLIRVLKRKIRKTKIGHCGTLDPLATGLVVILLGRMTKRQAEWMGRSKQYRCRFRVGVQTDTGDVTGKVILRMDPPPYSRDDWERVLSQFMGEQMQIPPMYSALKVNGKPLYKLARKGEEVARKPRPVRIDAIELLEFLPPDEMEIRTTVSSGTYIRVLVEDIGKQAGSCATVTELRREAVGSLSISGAVPGSQLPGMTESEIEKHVHAALPHA